MRRRPRPEGYGEIIGGSQRVDSYDLLKSASKAHNLPLDAFQWYLDLRKYGSVPHAGFGMGIERVVAWICGLDHVRETIPSPERSTESIPDRHATTERRFLSALVNRLIDFRNNKSVSLAQSNNQ